VYVRVCQMELSDAELKLLFGGHDDIFTEVQDRMSLTATQVTPHIRSDRRFVAVVLHPGPGGGQVDGLATYR